VAIYMKYGSIEGDATQAGFEGWINVSHFDWQIQYTITNRAGLQHNTRDAKRPKIEEFTINKRSRWRHHGSGGRHMHVE
jgi:type VI protein secretion system component Hcp